MLMKLLESYSNWYVSFREKYTNAYIIMISILVTLWFHGMYRIIDRQFPDTMKINLLLMIVPALLMYFGDGRLEEIYNFEAIQKRVTAMQGTRRDGGDSSSLRQ